MIHAINKIFAPLAYYSALPLAFVAPDARVLNAAVGATAAIWLTKRVAGIGIMLARSQQQNKKNAGYKAPKEGLRDIFKQVKGTTAAAALMAGTALATASFVGWNTVQDVRETGRAPVWALAGNTVDLAYHPTKWALVKSADLGQFITGTTRDLAHVEFRIDYFNKLDGAAKCLDNVVQNKKNFAGTCSDHVNGFVNPVFDRK